MELHRPALAPTTLFPLCWHEKQHFQAGTQRFQTPRRKKRPSLSVVQSSQHRDARAEGAGRKGAGGRDEWGEGGGGGGCCLVFLFVFLFFFFLIYFGTVFIFKIYLFNFYYCCYTNSLTLPG